MPAALHALSSSNLTAKTHIKSKTHIGSRTQRQEQEEGGKSDQNENDLATPNVTVGSQMHVQQPSDSEGNYQYA